MKKGYAFSCGFSNGRRCSQGLPSMPTQGLLSSGVFVVHAASNITAKIVKIFIATQ